MVVAEQQWAVALLQAVALNGLAQLHNCATPQQMPATREATHIAGNAIKNKSQFVNCSS